MTSRQWQWDNASELIAGEGRIVAEYGDIGYTRRLRWDRRPPTLREPGERVRFVLRDLGLA